jgi:hypothetical protein
MATNKYSDIRELLVSIRKQALDIEPSGTGKFLNEFIDFRSRIKQNRLNNFIESFQSYLQQSHSKETLHFDLLSEEDFTDILESVLKRVAITKSIKQLDRFKIVLEKSLSNPQDINFTESFLDLITRLHETQIEILIRHDEISTSLQKKDLLGINNSLRIELANENTFRTEGNENKYEKIQKELDAFTKFRSSEFYKISKDEYTFFIQDLSAKSLLIDFGVGGIGVGPFDLMEITEYGRQFLQFIKQ